MEGIGNFFSSIFGGGKGGGFQPTDINPAPAGQDGVLGIPPSVVTATSASGGDASPLWMKLLTGGLFGSGELGNLLQSHKQNQYQDLLLKYAQNPTLLTQAVTAATKPLDNALVQAVNNRVQGDMAARGLAQAPGIFGASEAQALAPFVQQNQQTAQQQVLASLGLPGEVTGINRPPTDNSSALAMFLRAMGQNPFTRLPGTNLPPQQGQPTLPGINFPDTSGWFTPNYPVLTSTGTQTTGDIPQFGGSA